jgi:hypothetical protein
MQQTIDFHLLLRLGSYVAVYGDVRSDGIDDPQPQSAYALDGGEPETYTPPANSSINQVLFYERITTSSGLHTLVVTVTRVRENPDSAIIIDYVKYM